MARNKQEQIAYLLKRRNGGMSNADYEKQLEYLFELGYTQGENDEIFQRGIREFGC